MIKLYEGNGTSTIILTSGKELLLTEDEINELTNHVKGNLEEQIEEFDEIIEEFDEIIEEFFQIIEEFDEKNSNNEEKISELEREILKLEYKISQKNDENSTEIG